MGLTIRHDARACPDCSGYGGCAYGLCHSPPAQLAAHDRVEKAALEDNIAYAVAGVETGKGVPLGGDYRRRDEPREFPLAPLLVAAGITSGVLGRRVRASGQSVRRAAELGCTVSEADRWACRLGFHPAEVWESWVQEAS